MDHNERERIYKAAISLFGAEWQKKKLLEEMAELQEALIKFDGGRDTVEHVAEEIADVTIMLDQLRIIVGVNYLVERYIDKKCARLRDRVD